MTFRLSTKESLILWKSLPLHLIPTVVAINICSRHPLLFIFQFFLQKITDIHIKCLPPSQRHNTNPFFWSFYSFILYSTHRNTQHSSHDLMMKHLQHYNITFVTTPYFTTHDNKFIGIAAHSLHLDNMGTSFDSYAKFKAPISLVSFIILFFTSIASDQRKVSVDPKCTNDLL